MTLERLFCEIAQIVDKELGFGISMDASMSILISDGCLVFKKKKKPKGNGYVNSGTNGTKAKSILFSKIQWQKNEEKLKIKTEPNRVFGLSHILFGLRFGSVQAYILTVRFCFSRNSDLSNQL